MGTTKNITIGVMMSLFCTKIVLYKEGNI